MNQETGSKNVLLAFDGSNGSRAAFPHAVRLAKATGGEIVLVRVYMVPPLIWSHPETKVRDAEIERLRAEWKVELAAEAQRLEQESGIKVIPSPRMLGERWTAIEEILAAADEFDPVAICLGTHGESALRHLLVGSIALGVLARSSRPVVLAKAQEK